MKKLLIVWILIAVFAFGGLTFIGFKIKKENEPYRQLESNMEKQANGLTGANPSYLFGGSKITIDELNLHGYSVNPNVKGDHCEGYVLIEQSMSFYKYTPYIKCGKYTTTGYK